MCITYASLLKFNQSILFQIYVCMSYTVYTLYLYCSVSNIVSSLLTFYTAFHCTHAIPTAVSLSPVPHISLCITMDTSTFMKEFNPKNVFFKQNPGFSKYEELDSSAKQTYCRTMVVSKKNNNNNNFV